MLAAGFVVADVRTLDKQQGSYRQVTSTAVKQDLVISAYKPNGGLEDRFRLQAGTEDGAWDFVRTHMRQLPVFVARDGSAEVIAERQRLPAYSTAWWPSTCSAGSRFRVSADRVPGRPRAALSGAGRHVLPARAGPRVRHRNDWRARELVQLELFVKDEESAIQWLRQQLERKPQTFQEIHPHFIRELGGWQKHERMIELSAFLEQNFLRYDGRGEVPSQIHSYLSGNFKELRNLPKDAFILRAKAKDRWYVPDPARRATSMS